LGGEASGIFASIRCAEVAKVSMYMLGIVGFSTYMEYVEYYYFNINDLHIDRY
jgi:hypothetical protein